MSGDGGELAFTSLLSALVEPGVDFVVIGGWALPVHGVYRTTVDVDVVPDPARGNLERLSKALRDLEAHVPGADPGFDALSVGALSSGATVKCLTRLGELHVVQAQEGLPAYPDLRRRAVEIEVEGVRFAVCSYEDLIAMKLATGRPQDEIDVTDLRRARGELE
ncbi:MAG: DUF6036 family nucleotidyltransferase [Solirubrobacterales bacterium]